MSKLDHDSYTGDEYVAPYVSKIPGIHIGRSPFYKDAELRRISAQYFTEPHPEGVLVRRADCPPHFFPVLPDLAQAVAAMDWCVRNDGSVGVAIHWLNKKEIEPYLNLLSLFVEAANGGA
jgi:hypothetical protein